MDSLLNDLRYGWRKLMRSPGFTIVAVVTLGLGIGANTAIFSVVDAILLRPLPYDQPDRLVLVWNRMDNSSFKKAPVAAPDVIDYREQARLFEGFAATNNVNEMSLTGDGEPEQIKVAFVTSNFFSVLGAEPFLGRAFTIEDETPIPPQAFQDPNVPIPPGAFIMSHGFWRRRFGGDPKVLGRTILINGGPMTVVGIMPRDFELFMPTDAGMPTDIDGWSTLRFDLSTGQRDNQWLRVIARLKPGVAIESAQAEMDAIAARQREQFQFHANMGIHISVVPMHGDVVGHVRPILIALFGAVGFVLLIACANVANLLLARAATRGREMAIRSALGAARSRILRQVLTEGVLLAILGGAAGLLLARLGVGLLLALRPADLPRVDAIGIDFTVLAFTLGATFVAALLFGLAPAFDSSGTETSEALNERGADSGRGKLQLRSALVVGEVALSLVLLIGAGLMLRSFVALQSVQPGFNPQGVLTYNISLPFFSYRTPPERVQFFQRMEERVAALPGVEAVGGIFPVPLGGRFWTGPYGMPGTDPETWSDKEANFRVVTPDFFEAFGARLLSGRTLTRADIEEGRNVVVVDNLMAQRSWPNESAVGEQLGIDLFGQEHFLEVVGVVEHMRHESLMEDSRETVYFPHHLFPFTQMTLAVRTATDPRSLLRPIVGQVREMDANLPVYNVKTMEEYLSDAMASTRFTMILIAIFAGVALVLASVGLYGVISYSVRQRTQEIGIRMAFGAEQSDILRLVVGRGMLLIMIGVGLGLAGSLGLTRVLASLLYGVAATDPVTYVGISGLLVAIALLACLVPAQRATRVDPMNSLRAE